MRTTSLIAALAAGTCFVAIATPAHAQQRSFNIPAGSLKAALDSYGRQSGRPIVYKADEVRAVRSPGYRGSASSDQALAAILADTGFTARSGASSSVAIVRVGNGSGSAADPATSSGDDGADNAQEGAGNDTEIVVTGTHLRGATPVGSPESTYSEEDIRRSGASTVQDFVRKLPQNFGGGASEYASALSSPRNGGGTNVGFGSGINLRGLGNGSTLVLLNGQRLAPGGMGDFVDISTLPIAAIKEISVVPDGASAIYGADAVGGVVNFILRDDLEGGESRVRYGAVTSGGLKEFQASQTVGHRWDSGNIMLAGDWFTRSRLDARDRGYANALAQRPTDLIPKEDRFSILASANLRPSDTVKLSAVAYYNDRHVDNQLFNAASAQDYRARVENEQFGGTATVEVELPADWRLVLTGTAARTSTSRNNEFSAGTFSPASRNTLEYLSIQNSAQATVDGTLFTLGGNRVKAAIGVEYRREKLDRYRTGFDAAANAPLFLRRTVKSAYAEVMVPLLSPANQSGLGERFEVTAAVRHEEYSDFGSTTNPKIGLLYTPIHGLDFRGTFGTSFRAPYLALFDNSIAYGLLYDTVNPANPADTILLALISGGARPGLGPERATSWTAGADLKPAFAPGFKLSATWFDVRYKDRIEARSGIDLSDPLLQSRISIPADPAILDAIRAAPQYFALSASPLSAAEVTLDGRYLNSSRTHVQGIDVGIEQAFGRAGNRLILSANASYLFRFDSAGASDSPAVSIVDTIFNPVDLKARAGLSWERRALSAAAFVNYTDSYRDNQLQSSTKVESWTTVDLSVSLDLGQALGRSPVLDGLSASISVVNAFDQAPPRIVDRSAVFANPGYDTENANPLGRFISFTLAKRF